MGLLVGRQRELSQLERALADARASRGRLVLLAGQPGIGKSRLADEATRAAAATMRVAWGRCWEAGGAPPFWPWIQILRALRRDVTDVEVPREIARVLPELGAGGDASAPAAEERFLLFDAIHRYASAAAATMPLAIVIEDLHAADVASLQVLAFFASHLRGEAICVIATYRTSEARTTPEVGALIAKLERDAETIAPRPLAADDIAALAADGGVTDERAVAAIVRASEGNPLFVRELVRLGAAVVPETVRAAIREHVGRVPDHARAIAQRAAILGGDLPGVLAALAERDDGELARELELLVGHGILVERAPGRFAFAHGLFAETLSHDVPAAERERLHGRAADLLAATGASAAEITRHLFDAGSARVSEAIASARRGAAAATQQLAFSEAAALLARAASAAPASDRELAIELAIELATAQIANGESRAGIATCVRGAEQARTLGDGARLARIATAYGRVITPGQTDRTLVALIEEALRGLPPGDSAERARLLARLAGALQPTADPDGPMAIARDAMAMARRLGEPRVVLDVVYTAMAALQNFALPEERRAIELEVVELATAHHEPTILLRSHYRLVLDCIAMGDIASAQSHARSYERLAADMRQPQVGRVAAQLRALFALHAGRLAEHDAELAEAARLAAEGDEAPWWAPASRMLGLVAIGDDAALRVERDHNASWLHGAYSVYETVVSAFLDMVAGDHALARAKLAQTSARELLRFRDMYMLEWAAEIAVRLGERSLAAELYEGMLPHRKRWASAGLPTLSIEPPIERTLGLIAASLGRGDDARAHFTAVIAELRAAGLPVLVARTLVEWATCGATTADEAARALTEARELATRFGLPLVGRIDAAGQRAPAPAPTPAPALSLVHEGATWHVTLGAASCRVKHARGVELLARLVADPTREVHVLELVGGDATDGGDAGELLDREAVVAYRARVLELREIIEDETDARKRDRARAELEELEDQLSAAVGLGGRRRRASNAAERARVNVQRRLTDAVKRIADAAPEIGSHLDAALRTGTYCSYDPRRTTASSPRS
jgi:hypothetical protein